MSVTVSHVQTRELDLPLTDRQRVVLAEISRYHIATGEPCPMSYLARKLSLHHSTVAQHVDYLRRKGALRSQGLPKRSFLVR